MSFPKIVIPFICAVAVLACKDDTYSPTYTYGEMSATVNGENWLGEAELYPNGLGFGYNVTGYISNSQGINIDKFVFSKIPITPGSYTIYDTTNQIRQPILKGTRFKLNAHGDVITGAFAPSYDRSENVLEVLEVDTVKQEMTAMFKGLFLRGLNDSNHIMQSHDSVRVVNGLFTARVR